MVKLAQLVSPNVQLALGVIAQKEIPVMTSFRFKKLLKALGEELKTYNEVRNELLSKFGDKDKDGNLAIDPETNNVKFSEENMKLFSEAMTGLLQMDVDIGTIRIADLGEKAEIKPNDLMMLDGIIVEE